MFRTIWRTAAKVQRRSQRLPANRAIARLRESRQVRWPLIAAVILVPMYIGAAAVALRIIEVGGPSWLNLFVLVWLWNAIKFTMLAVIQPPRIIFANLRRADNGMDVPKTSERTTKSGEISPATANSH